MTPFSKLLLYVDAQVTTYNIDQIYGKGKSFHLNLLYYFLTQSTPLSNEACPFYLEKDFIIDSNKGPSNCSYF